MASEERKDNKKPFKGVSIFSFANSDVNFKILIG